MRHIACRLDAKELEGGHGHRLADGDPIAAQQIDISGRAAAAGNSIHASDSVDAERTGIDKTDAAAIAARCRGKLAHVVA